MSGEDSSMAVAGVFFVAVVTSFLSCSITRDEVTKSEQEKAISAGVGRWIIDPKTGESRFVYGVPATSTGRPVATPTTAP
jgi:hypothetical protein